MKMITPDYLNRAELWLLITMLAYFMLNGAQLFETAVVIPRWAAKPPASLVVLQGPNAPDLKTFWIVAHSVHELTFLAAILFCWQILPVRNALLLIFAAHVVIRLWTIGYFAPAIMAFQTVKIDPVSAEVQAAVGRWRDLNYIRVAAFVGLSVAVAIVYGQLKQVRPLVRAHVNNQCMEQRVSVLTLGVDDLPAQIAFYKMKIGWQPVAENKDIIFFRLNGFLFSLFDRKALAEGAGIRADGEGFRAVTLSYNVAQKEQVDQLYRQVKANQINVLKAPTDTPFGGYYFTFADLERNVWEVAYNPYIPLDEVGNVITHNNIDAL